MDLPVTYMSLLLAVLAVGGVVAASIAPQPVAGTSLFPFEQDSLPSINSSSYTSAGCRVIPGDAAWPTTSAWSTLNRSVDGQLLLPVPAAASCHNGLYYNASRCTEITTAWSDSDFHDEHPTSEMSPYAADPTLPCDPTTDPATPCRLGAYPIYVVNVSTVRHIQHAVRFARVKNIRLVVKNTGHDFLGRSAGAHALSIWTHHLKDIQFMREYVGHEYVGPAFKVGTGVQAEQLYGAARDNDVIVVGGEGITVGWAGGYIQGGGHSPMGSVLGMAADHVLGFQVVTPDGNFITADAVTHPDLFWALRGGGGSTFGVVTSVVVKAHQDRRVTVLTGSFAAPTNGSTEAWWAAVKTCFALFPELADSGVYSYWFILPPSGNFVFGPLFAPSLTAARVMQLLSPLSSQLAAAGIAFAPNVTEYSGFYYAWRENFPKEAVGYSTTAIDSRLFPRALFADSARFEAALAVLQRAFVAGHTALGFNLAPGRGDSRRDAVAVNPAWRDALAHVIVGNQWVEGTPQPDIDALYTELERDVMQPLRALTPGSGAYQNEANTKEPNWQFNFFGSHYEQLSKIKHKYDPQGVFYAKTAVGSERWSIAEDGRLCLA